MAGSFRETALRSSSLLLRAPVAVRDRLFHGPNDVLSLLEVPLIKRDMHTRLDQILSEPQNPSLVFLGIPRT